MNYELTEEQTMLKDTMARIAREQIAPGAAKRDETVCTEQLPKKGGCSGLIWRRIKSE